MRKAGIFFVISLCLLAKTALYADSNTFSLTRIEQFYNTLLIEEKEELALRDITSAPFTPPTNPPAPVFKTGLLPMILVNNSGVPDTEVYVLITGKNYDIVAVQVWGSINTTPGPNFGVVTLDPVAPGDNSTSYSVLLSSLPLTTGGRVIYLPETQSGLVWFSIDTALSMTVNDSGGVYSIVQPNFMNSSDPNYYTNFDIFEFTFDQTQQIYADATAVSFFSLPLYGYLSTATSASSTTGLYQARSYIMSKALGTFNSQAQGAAKTQWPHLFLKNGNSILRLASTGKAISAGLFDSNYLDNSAAYGYSYIQSLWSGGSSSYYQVNPLLMSVTITVPSTGTFLYTGQVDETTKEFIFTTSGADTVTFLAPTTGPAVTNTTTYNIESALNLTNPTSPPTAGTAADAVSKLFEEAVVAGLLPLPVGQTLSLDYLSANQSKFYTVNPNLSATGQSTGPWYDLYSKALHALGSIYTYGFDEPLWPQVLLKGPFIENSTYLSITIGSIQ